MGLIYQVVDVLLHIKKICYRVVWDDKVWNISSIINWTTWENNALTHSGISMNTHTHTGDGEKKLTSEWKKRIHRSHRITKDDRWARKIEWARWDRDRTYRKEETKKKFVVNACKWKEANWISFLHKWISFIFALFLMSFYSIYKMVNACARLKQETYGIFGRVSAVALSFTNIPSLGSGLIWKLKIEWDRWLQTACRFKHSKNTNKKKITQTHTHRKRKREKYRRESHTDTHNARFIGTSTWNDTDFERLITGR